MNMNDPDPIGHALEIDSGSLFLNKGLLSEDSLKHTYINSVKEQKKESIASTNPSEVQERLEREPEYHDTCCACLKRLIMNCVIGVFIDSLKTGILGNQTS